MKKELIPFNLQFFAEEPPVEEPPVEEKKETTEKVEEKEESLEEKFEKLMIENKKLKLATDKATSEASSFKKQLREKQSSDEIALQEKAEKEAAKEEQFNNLNKKVSIYEAKERYLSLGYSPEMADKAANAEYEKDFQELMKIQKQHLDTTVALKEAEWLKTRPEAKNGVGEDGKKDPFLEGFGKR